MLKSWQFAVRQFALCAAGCLRLGMAICSRQFINDKITNRSHAFAIFSDWDSLHFSDCKLQTAHCKLSPN
jgi:hypothetical protein